MSLIDDALRRAQQAVPDPRPQTDQGRGCKPSDQTPQDACERRASCSVSCPSATAAARIARAPAWRFPSLATIILIALAIVTLYTLREPGWGDGLRTWWQPAQPAPLLAEIPPPEMMARVQAAANPNRSNAVAPPQRERETARDHGLNPISPHSQIGTAQVAEVAQRSHEQILPPQSPRASGSQTNSIAPSPPAPVAQSQSDITSRYQLSGIMLSGRKRLAIVNGAILGVGDRIDNSEVTEISQQSITLSIDGHIYLIALRSAQ